MNTREKNNKIEKKQLKVKTEYVYFRDIEESPVNAQEMHEKEFNRLVKNLKRDGVLTTAPLIMEQPNKNKYMCISGHHRIRAAIKAGIEGAICLVTEKLDDSTRVRIQISHNDIHGEPNKDILAYLQTLLSGIDISLVDTTGIELENSMQEQKIDIPDYQYINICLIRESRDKLVDIILHLEKSDAINWLISKDEYEKIKDLLTYAFDHGFKTPGQSFGKFLNIIENSTELIKR